MQNDRYTYHVGVRKNDCIIFRTKGFVNENNHPENVGFSFGPYRTRKHATRIAMWQNYRISNDMNKPIPIWPGEIK
jgi:hypothetical protein